MRYAKWCCALLALWMLMAAGFGGSGAAPLWFATATAWADDAAAPAASGTPQAFFVEPRYAFAPIMEGVDIEHEFIVENRGKAPLAIYKVQPD